MPNIQYVYNNCIYAYSPLIHNACEGVNFRVKGCVVGEYVSWFRVWLMTPRTTTGCDAVRAWRACVLTPCYATRRDAAPPVHEGENSAAEASRQYPRRTYPQRA